MSRCLWHYPGVCGRVGGVCEIPMIVDGISNPVHLFVEVSIQDFERGWSLEG